MFICFTHTKTKKPRSNPENFYYNINYSISMVTTIQVSDKTKHRLDKLKKKRKTTYDEIVKTLLNHEEKSVLKEQIASYYAKYADEDLKEVKEWKHTETTP